MLYIQYASPKSNGEMKDMVFCPNFLVLSHDFLTDPQAQEKQISKSA